MTAIVWLRNPPHVQPAANPSTLTWIEVEPAIQKKIDDSTRREIVNTEVGHLTKEAAKDAFLGERTQTVERETVGKIPTLQDEVRKQAIRKAAQAAAQNLPVAREKTTESAAKPSVSGLAKFGVPLYEPKPPKKDASGQTVEDREDVVAEQGANPQDYVKGVKQSERTLLNTKEFVFYSYFQRIRQRLDQAWVPILRHRLDRLFRVGRTIATDMDHSTRVLVVLNDKGEVIRVSVTSASGTSDLDDSAVQAFNEAGPFPNPPKGIVDQKREIEIPWEFILKT